MSTQIQIYCNKSDWVKSILRVVGVEGVLPKFACIRGDQLPEAQAVPFNGIVELFRQLGASKWDASFVVCSRRVADGDLSDAVIVRLEADAGYGRQEMVHVLDDAGSVALYDALISAEFWAPILEERYTQKEDEDDGEL